MNVYQRVAKWNAARYDREYNKELTCGLLAEEYGESLEADNLVDVVDVLCDIIFVAYGAIWKLDVDGDKIAEHMQGSGDLIVSIPINFVEPLEYIGSHIVALTREDADDLALLCSIIHLATSQMSLLGIDETLGLKCFEAVCDSNDSKSVQKTSSDVKANQDKGPYYQPPKLAALLETLH